MRIHWRTPAPDRRIFVARLLRPPGWGGAQMTRVRGAGARRSSALWLAASPCAPLVGGRDERSGLDSPAWAGTASRLTPVAIRAPGGWRPARSWAGKWRSEEAGGRDGGEPRWQAGATDAVWEKSGGPSVRYDPAEVPSLGGFDDEGSGNRITGEGPAVRRLRRAGRRRWGNPDRGHRRRPAPDSADAGQR